MLQPVTASRQALLAVIAAFAVPALLWFIPIDGAAWMVIPRSAGIIATGLFLYRVRTLPPGVRDIWWCFWWYHAITVAADVWYDVLTVRNGEPPFPGPTDVLYLATYPFALAGLRRLTHRLSPGRDQESWLDAAIIAVALASVVGASVIGPVLNAAPATGGATLLSIAYPVLDVLVVAVLLRAVIVRRAENAALELLAISMVLMLGYDLAFNYLSTIGDWSTHRSMEFVWNAALLLMVAAVFVPGAGLITPHPVQVSDSVTPLRASMLAIAVMTPLLLLVVAVWNDESLTAKWLAPGGLLVGLLVIWRMYRLLSTVQAQSAQLADLARTDPLTGIANRRTWDHELERAVRRLLHEGQVTTVVLLDLDHFKQFNDEHGHQAADDYLVSATAAWQDLLGDEGFLARYGGEEFGVLLPGYGVLAAMPILERLRAVMPSGATVSIGASELRPDEDGWAALRRADEALYRAKAEGRDRVVIDWPTPR